MSHSDSAEHLQSAFECSVCLETFQSQNEGDITTSKVPRLLGCGHTFCTGCLVSLNNSSGVECPQCRTVTRLDKGIEGLKSNYTLMQIIDALPKDKRKSTEEKNELSADPTRDGLELLATACRRLEVEFASTNDLTLDDLKNTSAESQSSQQLKNLNITMTTELSSGVKRRQAQQSDKKLVENPFKVVIAGPSSAGKSSLGYYLQHGQSCLDINPTHGANVSKMNWEFESHRIRMELWDTVGQERQMNTLVRMEFYYHKP